MKRFFVPAALLLLAACHSPRALNMRSRSLDTFTVKSFNDPRKEYRASADQDWIFEQTTLKLSFDYAAKTASGKAALALRPYRTMPDSLHLDAKSMQIHAVRVQGRSLSFRYDSLQLHLPLSDFSKDTAILLEVDYTAMPYATRSGGSAAITDDRGLYFINTDQAKPGKPVQIWTQGETEANSHWMPTIDKPNMRSPFRIELTVPDKYVTLSNGSLISSLRRDTLRTDIWVMKEPIQMYAAMFAIGDFRIVRDSWRDKPVHYYVEPAYEAYASMMFRHTPEMMEFFSRITGVAYPWDKYHQIVVRDYVSGAMENTSASLFGSFMNQDTRAYADNNHEDVVAHELFHQWFGDLVTAESWSNLTVNESFANYGEYLWRHYKYGKDEADRLAWQDLQRYLSHAAFSDPSLVRFRYADKEDMFDHVSYQKGGAILHYLHHLLGDQVFSKAMNIYLTRNRLRAAEAVHWRLAVEEADGRDWNWFFDQWYLRGGHPELDIQYQYNDAAQRVFVTVTQKAPAYRLPLDVLLISGTGSRMLHWDLRTLKDTFSYAYEQGQAPLLIPDAAHVLPGNITEHKTPALWLRQMQQGGGYLNVLMPLRSLAGERLTTEGKKIIELGLENQFAGIRETALSLVADLVAEASRSSWTPSLKYLAEHDHHHSVRARALSILGAWKDLSARPLFLQSVNDSSYLVAGAALYALHLLRDTTAYERARIFVEGKQNNHLAEKSWEIIAARAKPADTSLFLKAGQQYAEPNQNLTNHAINYMQRSEDPTALSSMLRLIGRLLSQEANESYREYYADQIKDITETLGSKKKDAAAMARLQLIRNAVSNWKASEMSAKVKSVYEAILR